MENDKLIVSRQAGAGSVIAYNYFDDVICGGCSGTLESGINAAHWIGSHHVLFEGNWSYSSDSDPVWGPANFITFMRNYLSGFRTPFYDYYDAISIDDANNIPGASGSENGAHGIGVSGLNYWESYVANVIGTSGKMAGWAFHATGGNAIWQTGFFDGGDTAVDGEV